MRPCLGKIIMVLCAAWLFTSCGKGYYEMSPKQFESFITTCPKAHIIDVRYDHEYMQEHIEGAINISVGDTIMFWEGIDSLHNKKLFAVYCRSGKRSAKASLMLSKAGYTVYNLKDGIQGWKKTGLPTIVCDTAHTSQNTQDKR